jgi:purine nucleosidase/non-specific riboncleoside hydrolase
MAGNRTFILDTDGGVDDAQALLLLIANGRAPDLVTTVFGNVELETATRNMLAVLAVAGVSVPVHTGADRPLVQPVIHAKHVHGEDGLGGAPRPARTAAPASADAVGVLRRTFREAAARGERADILMIGPLTNLALALRAEPAIIAGIGVLTIMGGTVYGRGNSTPAAEFNIYADPEAAQVVLSADIETVIVPWEPCMSHRIAGAELDRLYAGIASSPARDFQQALAAHTRRGIVSRGHPDVMFFVDPLAAAVAVDPAIVTKSVSASAGVALAPGITRGMTVCDPSGRLGTRKHTFDEEADIGRVIGMYAASAAYAPQTAYETT